MDDNRKTGSFWTTVPGILAGCAALITAVGGLITVLITAGVILRPTPIAPTRPVFTTPFPTQSRPTIPPASLAPVQPTSGPQADYELTFVKVHNCNNTSSTPWAAFKFRNTGDISFAWKNVQVVDLKTGSNLYNFHSSGFHSNSSTCGVGEIPQIVMNQTAYTSVAIGAGASNLSGHTAQASITLCSEEPPRGVCVAKTTQFVLP